MSGSQRLGGDLQIVFKSRLSVPLTIYFQFKNEKDQLVKEMDDRLNERLNWIKKQLNE